MTLTKRVIVLLLTVVALYDILVYLVWGVQATISRITIGWVHNTSWGPLIPLAIGVLLGHLIWAQPQPTNTSSNS